VDAYPNPFMDSRLRNFTSAPSVGAAALPQHKQGTRVARPHELQRRRPLRSYLSRGPTLAFRKQTRGIPSDNVGPPPCELLAPRHRVSWAYRTRRGLPKSKSRIRNGFRPSSAYAPQ